MILTAISNMLQAFVETFAGGFRGGQYLPTGRTILTRSIWAVLMSGMMFLHGWTLPCIAVMAVVLYFTEAWFSHVPYQGMQDSTKYLGMWYTGNTRGIFYALGLAWWYGHQALWLVPLAGFGLVFAYAMDKFIPQFNVAEEISNFLLWASLAFFPMLPVFPI